MARRRRRKDTSPDNDRDRWLVTYADMMTLLLIFFIIMYTISQVDANKFESLANSLANAMGAGGMVLESPGPSVVPGNSQSSGKDLSEREQLEKIREKLQASVNNMGLSAKITTHTKKRGIVLSFQEEVLFDLGSARIRPSAKKIIKKIAPVLAQTDNYIRIEGHTDNLPIHTQKYPSNWELSGARAITVLKQLLQSSDLIPSRMSALAYSKYRPREPNDTPNNRQLNRRVNIVILRDKYKGSEPGSADMDLDNPVSLDEPVITK
ncbi:MAG: OmpA family protein [Clostridiales bacterium]|nr:OmpA family protein [Clostridiales bacterium]MCF8021772.1 OmpA family protein [Clostridiales bacterium]